MPATRRFNVRSAALIATATVLLTGCGGGADSGGSGLSGQISVDGSSTVYPFSEAAAETFKESNPGVNVTVGESGTGGGFEKFCAGEIDFSNASRAIKPEEKSACKKNGIKYREIQVAVDGISVVTNKGLAVDCLTTGELKQLWDRGSKANALSSIKSGLPGTKLSLYGPGTDSGTFDFFTDKISGEEGRSRTDYQPSEDDNVTVQGIEGDAGGFGYFGFSYYEQNADKLNLVGVDGGKGCVKPSKETIQSGEYTPLSRPLFVYVSEEAYTRPEVAGFALYMVEKQEELSGIAKTVPLNSDQAAKAKEALDTPAT